MNRELKFEPQDEIELQVVSPSQIVCSKCGSDSYVKAGFKESGSQKYCCKNCKAQFVPFANRQRLVEGDDTWTAADLGLLVKSYRSGDGDKLNFAQYVYQDWLKIYIKKFIKYTASQTTSFQSLQGFLYRLKHFSQFLLVKQTVKQIEDITQGYFILKLE